VSVALYCVVCLAIWSGPAIPAAQAHHSISTTNTPHVETIVAIKEKTSPSMLAHRTSMKEDATVMKEDVKAMKEDINALKLRVHNIADVVKILLYGVAIGFVLIVSVMSALLR
jgi:hypothetical protein